MAAESQTEQKMPFDKEKVIEEMLRDSGAIDFVPFTLRLHGPFYEKVDKFCNATGIKKSVLLRRLCEIGWELVTEEKANGG